MRILYAFRVRSNICTSHESCHLPSGSVVTVLVIKIIPPGLPQFTETITPYVTQASRLPMTKELFVVVPCPFLRGAPAQLMV